MLARQHCRRYVEAHLILPVFQADPLQLLLVITIERLGDDFVAQQVGLDTARYFGRSPISNKLQRRRIDFGLNSSNVIERTVWCNAKLPTAVQIDNLFLAGAESEWN